MGIEAELTTRLKEAMRGKNAREVAVLRMVKTQATQERTAAGFSGETDDAFWLGVIQRYVKQQKKALAEYEKLGAGQSEQVAELRFEIEYLTPFLPAQLDDDAVRALVRAAIAETGAVGAKMVGRIVGAVLKEHRDEVDPAAVKRIATEELG